MGCSQSKQHTVESIQWDRVPSVITCHYLEGSINSQATPTTDNRPVIAPNISQSFRLYIPQDIINSFNNMSKCMECLKSRDKRVLMKTYNLQGKRCCKATYTTKITFETLIHSLKHAKKDELGRLVGNASIFWRVPEVEASRVADYEELKRKYRKPCDRLHIERFGWLPVETENGKITSVRSESVARKIVWTKNKYPYAWEDGLEHYVCWSTDAPAMSIDECLKIIKEKVDSSKESVWFTTSTKNRVITGVDHIHVVVRNKI